MRAIIGVDPGVNGAIVCLSIDEKEPSIRYAKLINLPSEPKNRYDCLKQIIDEWRKSYEIVATLLEKPFALRGQGNILSYGTAFGHLECILCLILGDVQLAYPNSWQSALYPKVKGMTAKQQSVVVFNKLFSMQKMKRNDDGVVDAALIAVAKAVQMGLFPTYPLIKWSDKTLVKEKKGWILE